MVIVYNSNDEIPPNTNWEFQSKNGGLNFFKLSYITLNARKKIVQKKFEV
jgi:hypothetical protein